MTKLDTELQDRLLSLWEEERQKYHNRGDKDAADFYMTALSAVGLMYCSLFSNAQDDTKRGALALLIVMMMQIAECGHKFLLEKDQ